MRAPTLLTLPGMICVECHSSSPIGSRPGWSVYSSETTKVFSLTQTTGLSELVSLRVSTLSAPSPSSPDEMPSSVRLNASTNTFTTALTRILRGLSSLESMLTTVSRATARLSEVTSGASSSTLRGMVASSELVPSPPSGT